MSVPDELLYSEEHEWVKKEDGRLRVGITDFAQSELGDIVFGEPFGSVESVKTVSELYAPVTGKVVEINEDLDDSPEFVNESPYEKAWMIVVEPSNESELDDLMSPAQYSDMVSDD
jgi:glycine cleavage system H protein